MLTKVALGAGFGLAAVPAGGMLGVSSAKAAVTSSHVTAPTTPSYFQENLNNPNDPAHQITISGTTTNDGTSGSVDLLCTYVLADGTPEALTIKSSVPVASNGTFAYTGPAPASNRACVIRAVPAGGGLPANLSPFTGPTVGVGEFSVSSVTSGPNNGDIFTYVDEAAQLGGTGDLHSLGGGGLFDAFPAQTGNHALGGDEFYAGGYLAAANADRADLEIDAAPAYAAATAETLVTGASSFTGLPSITFTQTLDAATGNVTIHESELLVKCAPDPMTYPATTGSCTSFASSGVKFDRTIVQDQSGRQAHFTDTYTSVDGKAHSLDLRYGTDLQNANAGFNFPWVDGSTYKTHAAGDTVAPPPSAPATVYLNYNNTLADGDTSSAQGAVTFAQAPSAFKFMPFGLNTGNGATHLFASYVRTIPAGGSTKFRTAYTWAFTKAQTHALGAVAEQSFKAPTVTTGAAGSITTTAAALAGSVNANDQATTYQFQYGLTTSYGATTPAASVGTLTSAVSVVTALTGLQPNTTYHFRLVATNGSGTSNGTDATFTTGNIPTHLKVGKIKVKGSTASVPLTCTGNPGVSCKGSLTATIKVRGKKKPVTVGKKGFSVAAGAKKTVKLSLNRKGRKALKHAKSHKLKTKVTVKLGSKKVAGKNVTFKSKKK
jgi:hypothetical protein